MMSDIKRIQEAEMLDFGNKLEKTLTKNLYLKQYNQEFSIWKSQTEMIP